MRSIPLTQGQSAIVDDSAYEYLSGFRWFAKKKWDGLFYAQRNIRYPEDGKQRRVNMHHLITGYPLKGMEVDHINGNGLDNRKVNLRIVTHRQNCQNRRIQRGSRKSSKYIGVYWCKRDRAWQSSLRIGKKSKYIGFFKNEDDAHEAYQKELCKLIGESHA